MVRTGLALLAALLATPLWAQGPARPHTVVDAALILPTDRYDHAVLGDALEWAGLSITYKHCAQCQGLDLRKVTVTLPATRVFEDILARVVDADGDGRSEVLVVETDLRLGAALAVYDEQGRRAATPFIGQRHRWLAPAGVGDFDGDGRPEIAYVDRPHLARELVFVRLQGDRLIEIARAPGLTNHRIGDRFISAAVRTCDGIAEVILPDAAWARLVAARLDGTRIVTRDAGPFRGANSLSRATRC